MLRTRILRALLAVPVLAAGLFFGLNPGASADDDWTYCGYVKYRLNSGSPTSTAPGFTHYCEWPNCGSGGGLGATVPPVEVGGAKAEASICVKM